MNQMNERNQREKAPSGDRRRRLGGNCRSEAGWEL